MTEWLAPRDLQIRYLDACEKASLGLHGFKQDKDINPVFEHVTARMGQIYLQETSPLVSGLVVHDSIGEPKTVEYETHGRLSPTTLRYRYVASKIIERGLWEKDGNGAYSVIEVGGGYGGQAVVLDSLSGESRLEYTIVDYHEAGLLQSAYLARVRVDALLLRTETYDLHLRREYGLMVSCYSIDELSSRAIWLYADNVARRCRHGYLTCNNHGDIADALRSRGIEFKMGPEPEGIGDATVIWW